MAESFVGIVFTIVILIVMLGVFVAFLLSLSKLVEEIRDNDLLPTYIHKAWIWTQLIPIWSFIAFLVLNIKLDAAARAIESKHNLSFKYITYPSILGWIISLGFFYTWIPIIGFIAFSVCMIMYWVKISATIKQLNN